MNYNWSMWKNGIGIVYESSFTPKKWRFVPPPLELRLKKKDLQVKFSYFFKRGETVSFALSFPWTYSQDQAYLSKLMTRLENRKDIYSSREVLIKSNLGNRVDMITITGKQREKDPIANGYTGIQGMFNGRKESKTLFFEKRQYIVISARVHPSEVASSFVLQGFIHHLLKKNKENRKFLRNTVLLILPMLNPDGVINGYTRLDINGYNLNAHYIHADFQSTPSISALINLIKQIDTKGQLFAYFDLHAHITKRGIFFFGNPLNTRTYSETLEIPYLFNEYQKDFNLNTSRFGVDKGESTSRKMLFRLTKKNRLYVLETNYWGNVLTKADMKEEEKNIFKHNLRIVKTFVKFFKVSKFKQIGRNLAKSLRRSARFNILKKLKKTTGDGELTKEGIQKYYKVMTHKKMLRKLKKKSDSD